MIGMAKDKPRTTKKSSDKRPRSGAAVQAFIDPDVREALDEFISSFNEQNDHKATVTSALEAALKMYLASKGHWPRVTKVEAKK